MFRLTSTNHRRLLLPLIAGCAALLGLISTACDKPAEKPAGDSSTSASTDSTATGKTDKIVVGFSQIGAESGWRTANTKSIKSEAEKRGIELKFSDAQGEQENQVRAIRSFIQQKVDFIAFSPKTEDGWQAVLEEAKKAGIPVILTDRAVKVDDDSLYVTFIGSDFIEEGRRAAEWLAKATGGKAQIAELQGTPGSAPAIDRKKGFEEVIAKHPEMKIIKSQSGNFERGKGKEVIEAFLRSPEGPQITALYAHNDDMALGAIQAIEAAGKKPGTDILIVSIDGVHDAFQAMLDKKLNCSVECNPLLGPQLFDVIEKLRKGESVPKRIVTEEGVFEQSQVTPEVLAGRQY
ncbi:MAG: LacI family transcriptional regulator [Planctomycetota bacterium]